MANKKLIAGGVIAVIILSTITVIGLIPVMMYGSGETLTQVNMGMTTDSSLAANSLSASSIHTSQSYSFSPNTTRIEVTEKKMNAYEYFFYELQGQKADIANQEGTTSIGANVDIEIFLNLTTPSGEYIEFEFNFQKLNAEGLDIVFLLDSEDLNDETGEFYLYITIDITIEIILDGETVWGPWNFSLNPSINFTV